MDVLKRPAQYKDFHLTQILKASNFILIRLFSLISPRYSSPVTLTRVDDRDSQLVFVPNDAWFLGGTQSEFKGTTRGTRTAGARMTFEFTGTGVEVYGTTSFNCSTSAVLNYFTLDNGTPFEWSQNPSPLPSYNVKMFDARRLKDMAHTLDMEVTVNNSETWIDYVEYTPSKPPSTSSQSGSGAVSSSSTRSGANGGVLSPGAVAGVAVGAMSGLILILLLTGWGLRRRWRRSRDRSEQTRAAQLNQTNGGVVVPSEM
ncbi:hypothetical protein PM082_023069 [Marasmius tenuissimus]|nr:hypothetical protein PM082_023069 [Marasmius tenuissimus]